MAFLIQTQVVIHQLFPSEKMEVGHFGNRPHRVHFSVLNVYNFLLVKENIKCGESFS